MIVEGTRWQRVDDPRVSALAEGALVRVMVRKTPVRFVRMRGTLRALADVCPHQGNSFEGGWCEDGHIVCPWHQMRFDPVTGRNKFGMTSNVEVFPVEEGGAGVRIGFPYTTISLFGWKLW